MAVYILFLHQDLCLNVLLLIHFFGLPFKIPLGLDLDGIARLLNHQLLYELVVILLLLI